MHEPIRDDFDATIDRTVCEMLAVEPDATFDARLRAAVPRRVHSEWPRLAAAAACAVLAAMVLPASVRWFEPAPSPDPPHVSGGGIEATRAAPSVPVPPDPTVAADASQEGAAGAPDRRRAARAPARHPHDAHAGALAAIPPGVTAAARGAPPVPVGDADPLPGVEPLPPIEPLTIASLPREAASLQARLIVPLEPIAAIEIAPLSPPEWRE